MVNVTYEDVGHNLVANVDGEEVIYNLGDMSWMIVATAFVWIMIPGLGFFYGGLLRSKNVLSMLWVSMVVSSIAFFTWFFWGFSLSFSTSSGNPFIGDLAHFGFINVDIQPSTGGTAIPQLLFAIFQAEFAAITPVIACGAFADRARLLPIMIFTFCWCTIVYSPIAYATWNVGLGWGNVMGGLDYAGGTPVHISSGTAALAISIFLGRRKGYGTESLTYRPANVSYVVLGTVLLWFGWNGFNGGSGLGANLRAVMAMTVTNLSAAVGGLTWMFWDYRLEHKWSVVGFCSGAISGLVAITPGSGYVGAPAAIAFGVLGGTICNVATSLKGFLKIDDTLDIFAAHAIGGIVGNICTAFFADSRVASFDGSTPIDGGWINHHWTQLGYQIADSLFGLGWSFTITFILLFAIDRIPGCHFRASEEDELLGMDLAGIGEQAWITSHDPEDVERAIAMGALPGTTHISPVSSKMGEKHQQDVAPPTGTVATHSQSESPVQTPQALV